jgi:hypothetical protein
MAGIYVDQHCELSDLLGRANSEQGATLLIPDLQRPYVWTPRQVILLVDSLIRGWPFGTFLTWKVKKDDPVRELARPFWKIVDRTDGDDAQQLSKKNPPASFQMVLDGQQRVQSLLLAVCGDAWGFKLFDRDWTIALTDQKPRGRQGVKHWSLGCLCVDVPQLVHGYSQSRRVAALDFSTVLCWVVTGGKTALSSFQTKPNYQRPLPRIDEGSGKGRYVRLSRLWDAAPAQDGVEQEQAESIAEAILKDHDFQPDTVAAATKPVGSLLITLGRVKRTRVTYLELAEYDERISTRDNYNDAVVNIFTRLNTAGRTLTREDITFAWLKVGWNGAAQKFEDLVEMLATQKLELSVEDGVAGISIVWSIAHADGRLLTNNDLLRGEAIRPMAEDLSKNWETLSGAVEKVMVALADRGYRFREHYESLNSVFFLWAWQYIADKWENQHLTKTLERDDFEKQVTSTLIASVDRWLMCSQWAGRWAAGTADTITGYARRMAECAASVMAATDSVSVQRLVAGFWEREIKDLETDAVSGIQAIQVRRRELVRVYYAPLWIWHRLNSERWTMSKIQLRTGKQKKMTFDVDHSIAHALWGRKVEKALPQNFPDGDDALAAVNLLGNCALLEKTFNVSKSDRSLKSFLAEVSEFKNGQIAIGDWAAALGIGNGILDPDNSDVDTLVREMQQRDATIRKDLTEFARGSIARVDLD